MDAPCLPFFLSFESLGSGITVFMGFIFEVFKMASGRRFTVEHLKNSLAH